MWKDAGACRFLGGRKVYLKNRICKVGKPHEWARVVRCVRGPKLAKGGFNYHTGKAKHHTKSKVEHIIGGMVLNSCYKFRAFSHSNGYIRGAKRGKIAYASDQKGRNIWKVTKGLSGRKNTISIRSPDGKMALTAKHGYIRMEKAKKSKAATFFIHQGLIGKHGVAFMLTTGKNTFLLHE